MGPCMFTGDVLWRCEVGELHPQFALAYRTINSILFYYLARSIGNTHPGLGRSEVQTRRKDWGLWWDLGETCRMAHRPRRGRRDRGERVGRPDGEKRRSKQHSGASLRKRPVRSGVKMPPNRGFLMSPGEQRERKVRNDRHWILKSRGWNFNISTSHNLSIIVEVKSAP